MAIILRNVNQMISGKMCCIPFIGMEVEILEQLQSALVIEANNYSP